MAKPEDLQAPLSPERAQDPPAPPTNPAPYAP